MNKTLFSILTAISIVFTTCTKELAIPDPIANFTYSKNGETAPCIIYLTNSSEFATAYRWDFGDGSYATSEENPTHTYTSSGTYTISLTARRDEKSKITTKTIEVKQGMPKANFEYTISGTSVNFTNLSTDASSYYWDFGDGNNSFLENPIHTYNTTITKSYTVKLTAKKNFYESSDSKNITINGTTSTTGEAIFWVASASLGGSYIDVYVSGVYKGRITLYSSSGIAPACGTTGYVTFSGAPGTYNWSATGADGTKWSSTITITAGKCFKMQLTAAQ